MPSLRQLGCILLASASLVLSRPTQWRRQAPIAVTGAQGDAQARREIHDLMSDPDQWNIYLLAVESFKNMDPSDPMSWYQIAGIHGAPFVEYNGSPQCQTCELRGYCTHSSTLFPTWHRAYVALFEQSLQANALAVASRFTGDDQQRYTAAAKNLRSPYWDWARMPAEGEAPFPDFFSQQSFDVNTPSGPQTIPNPLASFSFGNADHSFADADVTVRAPTFSVATRQQTRSDLWNLLTSQSNYNGMSTRALKQQGDNPNSIESLHDSIHVDVGGSMGNPDVAAFDPVFWLHHTNVDRILALYQALWPETWLESANEVGASMTYTSGSVQDSNSILEPFGVNSESARSTGFFNYFYNDNNGAAPIDVVNDLYGNFQWSAPAPGPAPGQAGPSMAPSDSPPALPPPVKRAADDTTQHEYVAKVAVDLPGTAGSFDIFIFDGAPDTTSPENWYKDADFLGQHGFFTDAGVHGNNDQLSHASVTLTEALRRRVESGELADMEPATVERHLKAHMQWRVVDAQNKLVPNARIPRLQVNVLTAELTVPSQRGVMPTWGEYRQLVGCKGDVGAWINGWCSNVKYL